MQGQIPQEVLNRIDALASKLGVTAQYIWSVLIKQAKVEAIEDVVSAFIFAGVVYVGWKLANYFWKKGKEDDWDFPLFPLGLALSIIGMTVFGIVSVCQFYSAITPIVNPEYWALQQVMNLFK